MTDYLFDPPEVFSLDVQGAAARYPVARIFCVGRNYAAHAAEMGNEVDREAPWYFTKQVAHAVHGGETRPYPPGTENYHHEVELFLTLGAPVFRAGLKEAAAAIHGYGVALDMTRRDRQQDGKDNRRPWSLGKDVEGSAVLAPLTLAKAFEPIEDKEIILSVNGETRQRARLGEMVWTCAEIVAHLSHYYHLGPGDLIMTGTPAGVGPVDPGDHLRGEIEGLAPVELTLTEPE